MINKKTYGIIIISLLVLSGMTGLFSISASATSTSNANAGPRRADPVDLIVVPFGPAPTLLGSLVIECDPPVVSEGGSAHILITDDNGNPIVADISVCEKDCDGCANLLGEDGEGKSEVTFNAPILIGSDLELEIEAYVQCFGFVTKPLTVKNEGDNLKISTDKNKYKEGDEIKVTVKEHSVSPIVGVPVEGVSVYLDAANGYQTSTSATDDSGVAEITAPTIEGKEDLQGCQIMGEISGLKIESDNTIDIIALYLNARTYINLNTKESTFYEGETFTVKVWDQDGVPFFFADIIAENLDTKRSFSASFKIPLDFLETNGDDSIDICAYPREGYENYMQDDLAITVLDGGAPLGELLVDMPKDVDEKLPFTVTLKDSISGELIDADSTEVSIKFRKGFTVLDESSKNPAEFTAPDVDKSETYNVKCEVAGYGLPKIKTITINAKDTPPEKVLKFSQGEYVATAGDGTVTVNLLGSVDDGADEPVVGVITFEYKDQVRIGSTVSFNIPSYLDATETYELVAEGTGDFKGITAQASVTVNPDGDPDNGILKGSVKDVKTGEPIREAEIKISYGKNTFNTETEDDGSYSITLEPKADSYSVTASAEGYYSSLPRSAKISPGETTTKNFWLTSKPADPPEPTTATIWGVVRDADFPNILLDGATIETEDGKYSTPSNALGMYSLEIDVPEGGATFRIEVTCAGYEPDAFPKTLERGDRKMVSIRLHKINGYNNDPTSEEPTPINIEPLPLNIDEEPKDLNALASTTQSQQPAKALSSGDTTQSLTTNTLAASKMQLAPSTI